MGEIAGRGAEEIALKIAGHYLRGRTAEDLSTSSARAGQGRASSTCPATTPSSPRSRRSCRTPTPGTSSRLMCHAERTEVDAWIREHGGTVDDARAIRRKVVAARGEHELESEIAALWDLGRPGARRDGQPARRRASRRRPAGLRAGPRHGRAGDEPRPIDALRGRRWRAGLTEPHRHRAQLQLASSLRVVGRARRPHRSGRRRSSTARTAPRHRCSGPSSHADLGHERQAVADLSGSSSRRRRTRSDDQRLPCRPCAPRGRARPAARCARRLTQPSGIPRMRWSPQQGSDGGVVLPDRAAGTGLRHGLRLLGPPASASASALRLGGRREVVGSRSGSLVAAGHADAGARPARVLVRSSSSATTWHAGRRT